MKYLDIVGDRKDELVRAYADRLILVHHLSDCEAMDYAQTAVDAGYAVGPGQIWKLDEPTRDIAPMVLEVEQCFFWDGHGDSIRTTDGRLMTAAELFRHYHLDDWPVVVGAES